MALAATATATALVLVIVLTIRDRKLLGPGGVTLAVAMWLTGPPILIVKLGWYETAPETALWVATFLMAWAIICGLGRPALLLSTLFMDDPDVPQRLLRASFVGQGVFVVGIIVFATFDAFYRHGVSYLFIITYVSIRLSCLNELTIP